MVYSSMTDIRIEDAKTKQVVEEFWEDEPESELDNAIKKQKDFLEKH